MTKLKEIYACQNCGAQYKKWQGKCDECNNWNTLVAENSVASPFSKKTTAKQRGTSLEIFGLNESNEHIIRLQVGIEELDRVLGGGLVVGSITLLGGDPGIGKSTILLQVANKLGFNGNKSLYISGEESLEQIKLRSRRLNTTDNNVRVAITTNLKEIIRTLESSLDLSLVIIDSIQTLYHEDIESAPGTVSQVRACAFELIRVAKSKGISIILVGHVTKEGQIAGPKVLEHMVDTVLYFEGDTSNEFRIIRSVKNRFGAANEIGIFEMTKEGLSEVTNPSSIFLPHRTQDISGSTIYPCIEGSRPILLEIQALIVPSFLATPRRAAIGWDLNRLNMMIAILNSRFGLNLLDKEVYLNVTGGLKITEPGADLAVAAALISAASNLPIPGDIVFIGEVGLSGELRQISHLEARLNEAYKLGFNKAILPKSNKNITCQIEQISLSHINELRKIILE
ncbi:DNA repair protein RadA [Holosporaceae bacterium 'Namur']|nr:DNA repair protein RadA [Holosporaceae bacterium 'Namur']